MSAAHTPKLAPTPENIGTTLARRMFDSRGNHFEIHLLEADLAALLKGAAEIALDGNGTRNVEALTVSRDALKAQNAELLEAATAGLDGLVHLEATYRTYASGARKHGNGNLEAEHAATAAAYARKIEQARAALARVTP